MDLWTSREVKVGSRRTECRTPGKVGQIDPADVVVPEGRLPLDEATVETLVKSIQEVGVLWPIMVMEFKVPDPDGPAYDDCGYTLVAGRHRLEACRRLEMEVPAIVIDEGYFSAIEAALVEIAENLHRRELTTDQKQQQFRRYVELLRQKMEAAELAKPSQDETVTKGRGGRGKKSVTTIAAEQAGISRATAHRYMADPKPAPEPKAPSRTLADDLRRHFNPTPEQAAKRAEELAEREADDMMWKWGNISEPGKIKFFRRLGLNYHEVFGLAAEAA